MMGEPLISVIVPVYNSEKYIRKCLSTICGQTFENIEILLIDDGSTDSSGAICDELSQADERIRVFHTKNSGVSSTRNYGVKEAKGEYILFADSDDFLEYNMVQRLYEVIQSKDVDVVRCKVNRYDINGRVEMENLYSLSNVKLEGCEIEKMFSHLLTTRENIPAYVALLLIKKEKIVSFNENLRIMEDAEFYVRLLRNINSIYFLDEALYWYRYNNNSATKKPENSIKVIHSIIDSISVIKEDLADIMTKEFLGQINTSILFLIFAKLKLFVKCKKRKGCIGQFEILFKEQEVIDIIDNCNKLQLSIIKKIELFLISKKWYTLLYLFIRVTAIRV